MLYNTDGGTPMVPIGEEDLPAPTFMSSAPGGLGDHEAGAKSRVFQGGFYQDLHKMLDISSGGEARSLQQTLHNQIKACRYVLGNTWRSAVRLSSHPSVLPVLMQSNEHSASHVHHSSHMGVTLIVRVGITS